MKNSRFVVQVPLNVRTELPIGPAHQLLRASRDEAPFAAVNGMTGGNIPAVLKFNEVQFGLKQLIYREDKYIYTRSMSLYFIQQCTVDVPRENVPRKREKRAENRVHPQVESNLGRVSVLSRWDTAMGEIGACINARKSAGTAYSLSRRIT